MKSASETVVPSVTPPVPLAVVGLGCLFPKADNVGAYWSNIKSGLDAITEVPPSHWRPEDYYDQDPKTADKVYAKLGGFLSPIDFQPMEYGILPNALEATDTAQLLGMVAVGQALTDAGYGPERDFDRERVSVILGVTGTLELVIPLGARLGHPLWKSALKEAGVADDVAADAMQRIADSYVPWQETSFPGLLGNVVAGRISRHFNFGGTNCVVDAACGSSLSALNLAALELAAGKADMVVTGGIDTFNDIFMYTCFSKTPALSPSGHARPFDADGDGTTLGEGLGILVLKRLADAERDGDRIYAVVKGIGSSSDGRGAAIYEPSAAGQQKALRRAYEQAGVEPATIGLIEAHGTGTKVGDAVEVKALRAVYGEADQPWCALGSVKSQIGHTKAAAGSAGLIKAVLALHHKILPPTIKVQRPNEAVTGGNSPFYVNSETRPWLQTGTTPRRAAVSALGFGGSNYHCVLEEYDREKPQGEWRGEVQLALFGAADAAGLRAAVQAFPANTGWSAVRAAAQASRAGFDANNRCRLALMIEEEKANLPAQLKSALTLLEKEGEGFWSTPDGAFYAMGSPAGKLAVLFPGQGAQYPHMLKELSTLFPELFRVVQSADIAFHARRGQRLAELLYPRPAFTAEEKSAQETRLRATDNAQPALGAVSLGAWEILGAFGVKADAFAGHSYGELVALCAAGVFDAATLHQLSQLRGELMAAGAGDRGSMLAVSAPLAEIETALREEGLPLVLANKNTPEQGVLSGSSSEIARAAERLAARGLRVTPLAVSAAFHSELVAAAAAPFAEALATVDWQSALVPVYANTSGAAYPAESAAARALLGRQLASPVEFVAEIEALYAAGIRTFIEVGPGARLTGMVKAILGTRDYQALALDASSGKRSGLGDLARLLAQLAVLGYPLDLGRWDAGFVVPPAPKKGLTVQISGANYFQRPPKRPPVERKLAEQKIIGPISPIRPIANTAPVAPPAALSDALRLSQQSMQTLQALQEQTARLHQQFLTNQETTARSFLALIEQQRQLLTGQPLTQFPAASAAVVPTSVPASAPMVPVVAPAAAASLDSGRAAAALLAVVSEKTGYPLEMLELGMSLDADLGIDSIKRVEILSALQGALPDLPAVRPEDLGTLQTLGQIVDYLAAGSPAVPVATAASSVKSVDDGTIASTLLAVVAEKTGYPVAMLELGMSLDADLGIDSIKRVEILSALQGALPDLPAVRPEDLGILQTLGQIVAHLSTVAPQEAMAPNTTLKTVSNGADVAATLLAVVAEKTGYPVDMLALDMSLDADLGIDSIKRVEILSALQGALPNLPAVRPEDLGTLQTLGQIVAHLSAGSSRPTAAPSVATNPAVERDTVARVLLEVIAEKTGYPVGMLELEMALDADLGIDSIKRVEILSALQARLPAAPAVRPEHLGTLQTVGQIVDFLASVSGATTSIPVAGPVDEPASSGLGIERKVLKVVPLQATGKRETLTLPEGAMVWISDDGSELARALGQELAARKLTPQLIDPFALDNLIVPTTLGGLLLLTPAQGTSDTSLQQAFALLQRAAAPLQASVAAGETALLSSVSRLNGYFGLMPGGSTADPLSGGLAGLVKTAAHEWTGIHTKALDLAAELDTTEAARAIVGELFLDGPIEVGLSAQGLHALKLTEISLSTDEVSAPLERGAVVVSGGARGVTAEVAVAFAASSQATLLLLGRSSSPEEEPEWLTGLTGEAEIKKGLIAQAASPLKPKEVEERYQAILCNREIAGNLRRIREAGGQAIYRSLDLRDADSVRAAIADVRRVHGPIRGLVHGAGVLADRLIKDKTAAQFEQVYSTKIVGLRSLLAALESDDLRFLALFSSSTGRFGRTGQVDYAVANEVLNKMAQDEARKRPACRVVALNWGPWDGGMVTPPLKKLFAAEGIATIDLRAGAEYLLREIATPPGGPVELVILGAQEQAQIEETPQMQANVYVSKAFDLDLSIEQFPFLKSHVIDKKAVLPLAMIVEWMAHGAIHNNPGLRFHGFNDLRVLKGVTLDVGQLHALQLMTGKAFKSGAFHIVPVELSGTTAAGQQFVHARAKIVLAVRLPESKIAAEALELPAYPHPVETIYRPERLFHGIDFHGIREVLGCSAAGISSLVRPAPRPTEWIHQPLRNAWLADPLVLDSSFQMMILWSFERYRAASLPVFVERYRQYSDSFPDSGAEIRIRVVRESASKAQADIDFLHPTTGALIARMENYECVIDASLNESFQRNKLQGVA